MQLSTPQTPRSGKRLKSLLLTLCLGLSILSDMNSRLAHAAEATSRQQAIEIAIQQNGGNGKVLGVQTMTDAYGQVVYAVKLLSNGRVRVFRIRQAN